MFIGTVLLIGHNVDPTDLVALYDQNTPRCYSVQKLIQLKARQRAAKKRVEERREALRLVQQRKAKEQQHAAIKIQAAAKGKRDRVSNDSLLHIRQGSAVIQTCRVGLFKDGGVFVVCRPPTLERTVG